MESYFARCEEQKMTNRAVFADNQITEAFSSLVTRNRRRVVYDFATALGLSVRFRKYSNGSVPYNIANLAFETETNFVHFTDHDTMLFYSECTRTSNVTQGLVVNRAPLLGPMVFLGPNSALPCDSAIFGGNVRKNPRWGEQRGAASANTTAPSDRNGGTSTTTSFLRAWGCTRRQPRGVSSVHLDFQNRS